MCIIKAFTVRLIIELQYDKYHWSGPPNATSAWPPRSWISAYAKRTCGHDELINLYINIDCWCYDWDIPSEMGQYHSCWCIGSLYCPDNNNHCIYWRTYASLGLNHLAKIFSNPLFRATILLNPICRDIVEMWRFHTDVTHTNLDCFNSPCLAAVVRVGW